MKLDVYLERTLPDNPEQTGSYFVNWNPREGKLKHRQSAPLKTLGDVALFIRQHVKKLEDVWVATGLYDGERKADHLIAKKVFHLDLDCGPKKPYPNQTSAMTQVEAAVENGLLPPVSFAINSGYGLHVYWELTKPLDFKEWRTIALRLKAAAKAAGLEADPTVTADAARILRPTETFNRKDQMNPRECKLWLDNGHTYNAQSFQLQFASIPIQAEEPTARVKLVSDKGRLTEAGAEIAASLDDLTSGLDLGPFDSASRAEKLRLIKDMLDHIDKSEDYGRWVSIGAAIRNAGINEGDTDLMPWMDLWDQWSQQAHNYDPAALRDKWDNKLPEFKDITVGTLIHYANEGGFVFPNALHEVTYPPGYLAVDFGTIRKSDEDAALVFEGVHLHDMRVTSDCGSGRRGYVYNCDVKNIANSQLSRLDISTVDMANDMSARTILAEAGIQIKSPAQLMEVKDFMQSFMTHLAQTRGGIARTTKHYGWVTDSKSRIGFTTGVGTYYNDGTSEPVAIADKNMAPAYQPKGSIKGWREPAQMIVDQSRQEINVVIASAFAAPLVKFTGENGATISLVSRDSGTGKSTALRAAQSVWGSPQRGIQALDDTRNYVTKKMEMLQHLPAYWDELRISDDIKEFIKLVFQLGQGKGKARLNSAAQSQEVGIWQTLIVVASNEPLTPYVNRAASSTDAGMRRLLELRAPSITNLTKTSFTAFEGNYGHAGQIYARWLAAHATEAEKIVDAFANKLRQQLQSNMAERFWIATIASTMAGAHIATKLDLLRFDLPAMWKCLIGCFKEHRRRGEARSGTNDASSQLIQFLHRHKGNSIKTDTIPAPKKGAPKAVALIHPRPEQIRHPLLYQISADGKLLVDLTNLDDWSNVEKGVSSENIVEELLNMGAVKAQRTLGAGTGYSAPGRTWCLVLTNAAPSLQQFFE